MKRGIPAVFRANGRKLLRACELAHDAGWVGVSTTNYVWLVGDTLKEVSWADVEGASWDDVHHALTLRFVDSTQAPWVHVFADGTERDFPLVVRERVQNSIVFQEDVVLPSSARARGLVRRASDESLFTQVIVDGHSSPDDEAELERLESSLRDVTGIPEE